MVGVGASTHRRIVVGQAGARWWRRSEHAGSNRIGKFKKKGREVDVWDPRVKNLVEYMDPWYVIYHRESKYNQNGSTKVDSRPNQNRVLHQTWSGRNPTSSKS